MSLAIFDGMTFELADRNHVQLRSMVPSDEAIFRDLYAEVRAAELAQVPWPAAQKRAFCDSQYSLQDKHYRTHYHDLCCLAICRQYELDAPRVIGRLYLSHYDTSLHVMDIALFAIEQRKGIGSQLMQAVIRHANDGGETLRLHVELHNPAKRLYEKLGFIAVGEAGVYQEMVRRPNGSQVMPRDEKFL